MAFFHKKCSGGLEYNGGNAYGCLYTCNLCRKIFVLPTKSQLRIRPHLLDKNVIESKYYSLQDLINKEAWVKKT